MSATVLDKIMENLATVSMNYATMLSEADTLKCTILALPKAVERLTGLKTQLENLQNDIQKLPEDEQKFGAETHTTILLNAINSILSTA